MTDRYADIRAALEGCQTMSDRANARLVSSCHPEVIRALLAERDAMKATLEAALAWHEAQDKAISKQPNANMGHNGWIRLEHKNQAAMIMAALSQGEANAE